jgi:hypothetical protein
MLSLSLCSYSPYKILNNLTKAYEAWFVRHGTSTTAAAYYTNISYRFLCLYAYPLNVALQRFGINVTAPVNTNTKLKEWIGTSFSMLSI